MLLKLKGFAARHKTALTGFFLIALAALVLLWNSRDISAQVDGQKQFEIYNDEYSTRLTMDEAHPELWQELQVPAEYTLYGMRLLFYTCEERMYGGLQLDICDAEGNVLTTAGELPTYDFPNGDFTDIVFDTPLRAADYANGEKSAELYLYLRFTPVYHDANRTVLELACSEDAVNGLRLRTGENESKNATLAIQFMTAYSGTASRGLFWLVALPLLLAFGLGWWLIYVRRARVHNVFALLAALLGVAFAFITPPLVGPDEYAHVAGSYAMASRVLGQPQFDEDGRLWMRECDLPYMTDHTGDIGVWAYRTEAMHLLDTGNDGALTGTAAVRASDTKVAVLYAAQTVGVLAARLLGLSFFAMLLLGRLCNLILYVALMRLAIKHMPRGKLILWTVGLLPMSLQLATTFSPDVLVMGLTLCYLAVCLGCIQRPATRRQKAALAVLALLIGPCKAIYVLVVGLCLWIPNENLGGKKRAWLLRGALCAAAVAGWLAANGSYVLYLLRDFDYNALARLALPACAGVLMLAVGAALVYRYLLRGHPDRQKKCLIALAVVCLVGVVFVLRYITAWGNIREEDKQASIMPNGDSSITYAVGYILRNPGDTFSLAVRSLAQKSPEWLQGMLGTSLGEPVVYPVQVNWLLAFALLVNLLLASLRSRAAPPRLQGWRRWYGVAIGLGVVGLCILACITWTPINYRTIFGVQGRYFLPVLPLFLLALGETRRFSLAHNYQRHFAFASVWLAQLVMLQALGIYAGWQMPSV